MPWQSRLLLLLLLLLGYYRWQPRGPGGFLYLYFICMASRNRQHHPSLRSGGCPAKELSPNSSLGTDGPGSNRRARLLNKVVLSLSCSFQTRGKLFRILMPNQNCTGILPPSPNPQLAWLSPRKTARNSGEDGGKESLHSVLASV